jgi:hypothetical protein
MFRINSFLNGLLISFSSSIYVYQILFVDAGLHPDTRSLERARGSNPYQSKARTGSALELVENRVDSARIAEDPRLAARMCLKKSRLARGQRGAGVLFGRAKLCQRVGWRKDRATVIPPAFFEIAAPRREILTAENQKKPVIGCADA